MSFDLGKFRELPQSVSKEWINEDEDPPFMKGVRLAATRKLARENLRVWLTASVAFPLGGGVALLLPRPWWSVFVMAALVLLFAIWKFIRFLRLSMEEQAHSTETSSNIKILSDEEVSALPQKA